MTTPPAREKDINAVNSVILELFLKKFSLKRNQRKVTKISIPENATE
jgi:hypothetical protein